ncbi:hypothetical protein H0G86_011476 [Trichoderma simmonsii]|uniref:Uncharacterized protein n=1 Tax=Trichoderma simmonsii TaxID=1491479 RepID=A0A8G0LLN2_9HYPO|nr:hypothetical protein H0G86_011476 [Trichoderma simmonsii]
MAELLRYTQEWHQQQQDIHPSDYIEETAEHNEIAELSSSLLALFKEIVLALSKHTEIPGDARISIERSCSALILWSDGFGIAQGRLNSTFNKSRKLRYTALKNLVHIGRVLIERLVPAVDISSEKLQALCSSAELNIEAAAGLVTEESCRQSDDSSSDAASNFSDDDIYEIAEDLKTDTLVLSGLDPLLKYPIFDAQHENIIESHALSTWGPEKSYSDKIGNRFPRADVSLTLYLGRANYERFLRCQEAREYQEEEEPLPIVNQEAGTHAGTIISNTKFHDSGVGTSIGLTMSYAETTMSYNHDGQSVRIPPLPKEAKAGSPFTCIACGRTVIITNNSAWKQHIYLDLQPYMCLDLSCPYSSSTFESRDKWISHLALDHEMEPKWASTECPLCREETGNGKIAITKHLSKHLEEVSLSALPVEVDSDAESENSPESSDASSSLNEEAFGGIDENGETLSVEFETELASKVFSNLVDKLKAERDHKAEFEAKGGALQQAADILAASEAENMAAQLKRTQENIEEMFRKKEGSSKMAKLLSPIKFTDAVGRRFNFPVHLCYTWQEMEDLIKQAFSQVDILGPRVQEGHYDLTGPDGKIILPSVWEETVEPGLRITMTMWPLDKAPLAGLSPKESEQPYNEEENTYKENSFQNNIPSKNAEQQREAQHSEIVQGARIIRMSGQNFFNRAKTYFKDQPDKFTRFRVILADITTTEWVPEAWRRSCFECRMAEAECDAKAPDPCTRCRLKKLSCAVQFAAVSRQHTVVNGDQIRQGIINIGRLCEGYPSFMHELNSVMPTGYRVEVLDASAVRLFAPDNEPTILQVGMPRDYSTDFGNRSDFDAEPNQQGKNLSGAPKRSMLANQDSSEAAIAQREETSHYFAQPTESRRTADHPVIDTIDKPELALELNKTAKSYGDRIEQRFIGSPHISGQLLEILRDAQNGTRSTENAYMVAKELFGLNSDLMDEFQRELTKLDADLLQSLGSALDNTSGNSREAVETTGDNVRMQEVMGAVTNNNGPNDPNNPQYCLCNKGNVGIMIRCDNVDRCKYKWFHLECVGLAAAPKAEWNCPYCCGYDSVGIDAHIDYLEGFSKFHTQRGKEGRHLPYVDKKRVDYYRLRNQVESRGGFDKVCKSKEWDKIAKDLGYSDRITSSVATSLKNVFLEWLAPYEEYLRAAKPGDDHQLEEEHVDPRNKGKEIPSIGRINYDSPNPDIYIWPPESNVPGEEEGETAGSPIAPPPLPPPVMAANDPTPGMMAAAQMPRPPYPPISYHTPRSNVPGKEESEPAGSPTAPPPLPPPVMAASDATPGIMAAAQMPRPPYPPISYHTPRSNSPASVASPSQHGQHRNLYGQPPVSSRLREIRNRVLPCEAEPPERRLCFEHFVDNESRDRHYLFAHGEFAREQGIEFLARACKICDARFHRRDDLRRHIEEHHSIHKEHRAAGQELTDLDNEDFGNAGTDTVDPVAAEARGSRHERDRGFFHTKVGAQVAQESAVQDRNVSANDEYMQAQAQVQAQAQGQPSASHNDDFISKATPASSEVAVSKDTGRLGPKIWTGTHFLPRFIRAAEVPGEGMCYFYDDGSHCKAVIDGEAVNAHWGVTKAGKPRKRLAIACITCREWKIKCDPDYPRCVQCEKFGRICKFKNAPKGGNIPLPSTSSTELDDGGDLRRSISDVRSPGSPSSRAGMLPVVKIPGTLIEYDGSDFRVTVSTNSAAGAGPGSGMPGSDKESTVDQAEAQDQDQTRGPQQADDDSTLQGEIQARGRRLVWDRLMEVAAEQFSDPENVSEETVHKIRHESYAQAQQIVKDLVQQRAQQQQQQQQ